MKKKFVACLKDVVTVTSLIRIFVCVRAASPIMCSKNIAFRCEHFVLLFVGLITSRLVIHTATTPQRDDDYFTPISCMPDSRYFLFGPVERGVGVSGDGEVPRGFAQCMQPHQQMQHTPQELDQLLDQCARQWSNGNCNMYRALRSQARQQVTSCMRVLKRCLAEHADDQMVDEEEDAIPVCLATYDDVFTGKYFCQFDGDKAWMYHTWVQQQHTPTKINNMRLGRAPPGGSTPYDDPCDDRHCKGDYDCLYELDRCREFHVGFDDDRTYCCKSFY